MMNLVSLSKNENGSIVYGNNEKPTFDILKIDQMAFAVVGALFLLFNLVYWFIFMIFEFN
jgi:hypothetical protein